MRVEGNFFLNSPRTRSDFDSVLVLPKALTMKQEKR